MIRYYGEYESASRFYIPIGHCLSLVNKQHRKQVFKIAIAKRVIRKVTLLVLQTLILFLNKVKLCTTTKYFSKCFVSWGYKNITKMYNLTK